MSTADATGAPGVAPGAPARRPGVELRELVKSYGPVHAVRSASLLLAPGSVTAVVGENGAGKSTLVKMLAGVETPDSGEIVVGGTRRRFRSAREASLAGIGMVFQETALVGELTVWENITLGWETSTPRGLDRRATLARIESLGEEYSLVVPATARVADLPVSVQQQVEILKVLYRDASVVILDEPTGVLTPQEARGLFRAVRVLRDAGKSVVFISHKLNEVLEIADTIAVMRAGEVVSSVAPGDLSPRDLARMMLGDELPLVSRSRSDVEARAVLDVEGLVSVRQGAARPVGPVSLRLSAGTVTGVAGVAGSGQDELVGALTGLRPLEAGQLTFHGSAEVTVVPGSDGPRAVRALRDAGLAYVPSDRGSVGTLATRPLWYSAIAGRQRHPRFSRAGILRRGEARRFAAELVRDGRVKAHSVDVLPGNLSGGNLQKLIVARELAGDPSLVVLEEPTRGIDVGSAVGIRQRLRDLAAAGAAVLVVSSDLDELLEVSDDVLVVYDGQVVESLSRDEATVDRIGAAMTGLTAGKDAR